MVMSLEGKTAVITGGGSGIGQGFAFALAKRGANIVVGGRDRDRIEGVASELVRDKGVKAEAFALDLGDHEAVERLCRTSHSALWPGPRSREQRRDLDRGERMGDESGRLGEGHSRKPLGGHLRRSLLRAPHAQVSRTRVPRDARGMDREQFWIFLNAGD
jgi:short subunit dehydrogenase